MENENWRKIPNTMENISIMSYGEKALKNVLAKQTAINIICLLFISFTMQKKIFFSWQEKLEEYFFYLCFIWKNSAILLGKNWRREKTT